MHHLNLCVYWIQTRDTYSTPAHLQGSEHARLAAAWCAITLQQGGRWDAALVVNPLQWAHLNCILNLKFEEQREDLLWPARVYTRPSISVSLVVLYMYAYNTGTL